MKMTQVFAVHANHTRILGKCCAPARRNRRNLTNRCRERERVPAPSLTRDRPDTCLSRATHTLSHVNSPEPTTPPRRVYPRTPLDPIQEADEVADEEGCHEHVTPCDVNDFSGGPRATSDVIVEKASGDAFAFASTQHGTRMPALRPIDANVAGALLLDLERSNLTAKF